MATSSNHRQRPSLPMSYSQGSVGSTNGLPMSQSHLGSFNHSQSVASTPTPTPPARASQQSAMSYSFPNGALHPSHPSMSNSFNGYDRTNGFGTMTPHQENYKPQIYRAVYSNVSVYEMEVNGIAVMKRRSDSWLNATQILKVAGVVKAKRTKTLEKEIAAGEHEKVQGGYGKYQGTWVSYQRGVELCREYQVEEALRPLLEYDMDDGNSRRASLETPTKEQAMAAQRKRLYSAETRGISQPAQATFFQNMSRTAANAVNAISKARFESPNKRRPSLMRNQSQHMSSQDSLNAPGGTQTSMYSVHSDSGFASQNAHTGRNDTMVDQENTLEPPRKRVRSSSNQALSFGANSTMSAYEPTPTEPNDSFYQQADDSLTTYDVNGRDPLPPAVHPDQFQKMKLIMTVFLDKRMKDFSKHPALVELSGEDLEIPLDEYQNSALHWGAMLARIPLLHALVGKGVNIQRMNAAGETALQKAVSTRNNVDYRSFPRLLEILGSTIDMVDHSGRSILHHIALMAATGGSGQVCAKHYLEALLEFIVQHGARSQENDKQVTNGENESSQGEIISLGRFVSELVNLRDDQGDTALNIAGRARSILVPQLLEIGADPQIPNHTGLRPADYGVGVDMVNESSQPQQDEEKKDTFINQLARTKKEILDATFAEIRALVEEELGDFDRGLTSDLSKKQAEFDHWHAKIRESARARQIDQNELKSLKSKASDWSNYHRRIENLERDVEDMVASLKKYYGNDFDVSQTCPVGYADSDSGVDMNEFSQVFSNFDPNTELSLEQKKFLTALPSAAALEARLEAYEGLNKDIHDEITLLKSKNVVLGETYRRVVMACTGFSHDQVDEAAEGLTKHIKDLNENPVSADEAIEILMRDRGQDW
ncbi:APSES transcription factor (MbpA), putative [Talaromyces stipitatus ATCC 10500]|uniref:Cell pattern formation-associated protein stuA n=1 Tax=Talaromyces stipitatus (strain ATCC 10500 / CBS 375.48 / QM 6759 / NRRL 1006) TaxID=441959 RepID=B8MIT1_TALSN|nr:APSES transcription factor (MbpA), putative [Talaromyces stipitatus ATCC 10500]EED15593.1 APSES transcription factor (MbpA), putative [Talaromyces stipitatus ATCC 10500]